MDEEFLRARADRINWLLDNAEAMGDGAAALGTLIITAATDEEYQEFRSGNQAVLLDVERRFINAGIRTA